MKRRLLTMLCCAGALSAGLLPATSIHAADWMFKPSNYSHSPSRGEVGPNRFARGPYYSQPVGAYFRGGYRHLSSTLSSRGQTSDNLHVFESWVQFGEQF
jgi:hypothetical protein